MGRETNIDSILALEEQIREHEMAAIRLKRARNSLLNVSKLPPELLGDIFRWNVTPKHDFDGLDKRSHNFILVCHHWFEVASGTPDLWSFWGNTPKDWARRCHLSGTASLDLVLGGFDYDHDECHLDTTLRNVLRDRATRDTIRRVHLVAQYPELLSSVLALLTANCEEPRSNSTESLILRSQNRTAVDVSDFFAHYRFPKLQRLDLFNCTISSWDHLTSRTSALTTLELDLNHPSPTPTASKLLSILASNPSLRKVSLAGRAVPGSGGAESPIRVRLRHLKELRLEGDPRHVVSLLHRLNHPRNMDSLFLTFRDSNVTDISQIIGPCLQDHLRRRDKPQNGLNLRVSTENPARYRAHRIDFQAGDAGRIDFSAPGRELMDTFIGIVILLNGTPHKSMIERAAFDLITYTPLEEVIYFHTHSIPIAMEDTCIQFPNLRALSFNTIPLPAALPNPYLIADGKTFPSLEHISLDRVDVDSGDWTPLTTFLAYRVFSGNQLDTLQIAGSPHMSQEVMEDIKGMVRELKIDNPVDTRSVTSASSLAPLSFIHSPVPVEVYLRRFAS